jgi:hypothetical protein
LATRRSSDVVSQVAPFVADFVTRLEGGLHRRFDNWIGKSLVSELDGVYSAWISAFAQIFDLHDGSKNQYCRRAIADDPYRSLHTDNRSALSCGSFWRSVISVQIKIAGCLIERPSFFDVFKQLPSHTCGF